MRKLSKTYDFVEDAMTDGILTASINRKTVYVYWLGELVYWCHRDEEIHGCRAGANMYRVAAMWFYDVLPAGR